MNSISGGGNPSLFDESSQRISGDDSLSNEYGERRPCPNCDLSLPISIRICPNDGTDLFLALDKIFAEKYELLEAVGSGAIGTIYKARHLALDNLVAIKVLNQVTGDKTTFLRFQREAKAASKITHPNVINVFDFGVWQDCQPYMVMDYLEGVTLNQVLRRSDRLLSVDEILDIMLPVVNALAHAHSKGILHRDLKPSNIMIQNDSETNGAIKLLDFGLAKLLYSDQGLSLSKSGAIMGSPAYMSPEQASASNVDARTDIYSVGCILFEMLTAEPPLLGESAAETFMTRVNHDAPRVSEVTDREIPPKLDELIARLLERNVSYRAKSAAWVYKELLSIKHKTDTPLSLESSFEVTVPENESEITVEDTESLNATTIQDEKPKKDYLDLSFIPSFNLVGFYKRQSELVKITMILLAVLVLALISRILIQ